MKTAGSKTCAVLSKSVGLLGVREVEQRPLSGSPTGCAPTRPAPSRVDLPYGAPSVFSYY